MLLAIANDVPDDQEVTRKSKLCDQLKFMLSLLAGLLDQVPFERGCITFADSVIDALGQKLSMVSPSGTGYCGNS